MSPPSGDVIAFFVFLLLIPLFLIALGVNRIADHLGKGGKSWRLKAL